MKELLKSLAEFQQEVPTILKDTSGYGYKYADLPAIFKVINPLMKKHGLGFTQLVNKDCLKTIVFHVETGEKIESETQLQIGVSLAKMNDFQVLGSQITYLRRYALSSILGLVTDVDNDANGTQTTTSKDNKENNLPWFDAKNIDKVVAQAKEKGMGANDLRQYYKISKANFELLKAKI